MSNETAYTVEGQIAEARASVGDITAEAQYCVSEVGVLRREDREIALASEVLRLRAALTRIAEGGPPVAATMRVPVEPHGDYADALRAQGMAA